VFKKIFVFGFLLGSVVTYAQVSPSARGGNSTVWVGGEFSSFDSDFNRTDIPITRIEGAGVFVDYNLTQKLGVEGEARWMRWNGQGNQTQSDYLGGVKYRLFKYHRFTANAKILLGGVWVTFPFDLGTGSYFAYAPGGYVDYRISRRLSVRGDYEYQFLPSAPNIPGLPSHGLTPNGFSVGVAYRILGVR
jgi:hypothetical protein